MNGFSTIVSAILVMVLISFLLSYPVMLLWNGCLVPAVSTLSQVTWLQALGIMIVCGFLFKSTTVTVTKS